MTTKISVVNSDKFRDIAQNLMQGSESIVNIVKDKFVNDIVLGKASDLAGLADGHDVVVIQASELIDERKDVANTKKFRK